MGRIKQAAGEDDRHDAGLVDAQRQELAGAAVDAPAANVLGRLRRDAPLPLGDGDHRHDDADEQDDQDEQLFQADVAAGAAAAQREATLDCTPGWPVRSNEQALGGVGNAGDDAGHDDAG